MKAAFKLSVASLVGGAAQLRTMAEEEPPCDEPAADPVPCNPDPIAHGS